MTARNGDIQHGQRTLLIVVALAALIVAIKGTDIPATIVVYLSQESSQIKMLIAAFAPGAIVLYITALLAAAWRTPFVFGLLVMLPGAGALAGLQTVLSVVVFEILQGVSGADHWALGMTLVFMNLVMIFLAGLTLAFSTSRGVVPRLTAMGSYIFWLVPALELQHADPNWMLILGSAPALMAIVNECVLARLNRFASILVPWLGPVILLGVYSI